MTKNVILVDENDTMTGVMPKMEAHLLGKLHRAFSVFIFNTKGELLLQQRALDKYHSGGKWTNTCCSHPEPGEETIDAAHRRLMEEMGMQCELHYAFNFMYKADLLDGIIENEFDHVYLGISDAEPIPNPGEVAAFKLINTDLLADDLELSPNQYTAWLKICFGTVMERYHQMFKGDHSL